MKTIMSAEGFRLSYGRHIGELRSVYEVVVRMNQISWHMADLSASSTRAIKCSRCLDIHGASWGARTAR